MTPSTVIIAILVVALWWMWNHARSVRGDLRLEEAFAKINEDQHARLLKEYDVVRVRMTKAEEELADLRQRASAAIKTLSDADLPS